MSVDDNGGEIMQLICRILFKIILVVGVVCIVLVVFVVFVVWFECLVMLIVFWGVGGGIDVIVCIIGVLLEKDLGQLVNVVNCIGGNGVVGYQVIVSVVLDGYIIGIVMVEILMMYYQGLIKLILCDLMLLVLMNFDLVVLIVSIELFYKNFDDLLKVIKVNFGKFKVFGIGQGGIWYLGLVGMLNDFKVVFNVVCFVFFNGVVLVMVDLVVGGVDIVVVLLLEVCLLIDVGKVMLLVIMVNELVVFYFKVFMFKSLIGSIWINGVWCGIVGFKGLLVDVQGKFLVSFKKIYDSKEYKDFMSGCGFGMQYVDVVEFGKFMDKSDEDMGVIFKILGMVR